MKNTITLLFSFSFILLLSSSCSSTKVISDKDGSVDFEKIKTYKFVGWTDNSDEILNRFDKERIEQAFAAEGAQRGLSPNNNNPDALVALFVIGEVKTQQQANTTTTGMGGMGGMGMARGMRHPGWGWGGGMGMSQSHTTITETSYLKGTLMIELFDPDEKKLIWQAVGTKTVSEDPKKREKGIPKKVAAIMEQYPIKPIN